ncbi:hypothetical protein EVA_17690 [gut metagenome]|uniref:Uncharacterized protein n=1 Tax=gut metagenome TaxID=749906 RepID=J9G3T8_9ZZZZ
MTASWYSCFLSVERVTKSGRSTLNILQSSSTSSWLVG